MRKRMRKRDEKSGVEWGGVEWKSADCGTHAAPIMCSYLRARRAAKRGRRVGGNERKNAAKAKLRDRPDGDCEARAGEMRN